MFSFPRSAGSSKPPRPLHLLENLADANCRHHLQRYCQRWRHVTTRQVPVLYRLQQPIAVLLPVMGTPNNSCWREFRAYKDGGAVAPRVTKEVFA